MLKFLGLIVIGGNDSFVFDSKGEWRNPKKIHKEGILEAFILLATFEKKLTRNIFFKLAQL